MWKVLKFFRPHISTLLAFCQINVGPRCTSQNERDLTHERERASHKNSQKGKKIDPLVSKLPEQF